VVGILKYIVEEPLVNAVAVPLLLTSTKSVAFELIKEDDAVTEAPVEVTEEPTTTTQAPKKSSKKETTEAPAEVTEEPITEAPAEVTEEPVDDIVVDEGDDE
jgi:hypothetical protein